MLIRTDPFREFIGWPSRCRALCPGRRRCPWTHGDAEEFVVELDIPGVDPESIDLDVERNVITVRAERAARGRA